MSLAAKIWDALALVAADIKAIYTALALKADKTYKVYTGCLYFDGTSDPTVIIVLQNTLGGTPVFTYHSGSDRFRMTLTGAFPNANKIFIPNNLQYYVTSEGDTLSFNATTNASVDYIEFYFTYPSLDMVYPVMNMDFELRVYN